MTRANTEGLKRNPWFAKAGAACSIVPVIRFVGPNIFVLKRGGFDALKRDYQRMIEDGLLFDEAESFETLMSRAHAGRR